MLSLLVPSAAPAQPLDAASLLALHHRYVGWQFGDGTFDTLTETGTVTVGDRSQSDRDTAVTLLRMGALYRETDLNLKSKTTDDSGFTGRLFWHSNENGFTHPVIGDDAKFYVSLSFVFNEGTSELAGTYERMQSVDGVNCAVVRVSPSAGMPIDLYIDPATGAFRRFVVDPDDAYETTVDVLAYDEVLPGKRVIASYRYTVSRDTETFSKIVANAPIATEQLHPPAQTATWQFSNAQPFPIDITTNRVLIDASINGVRGRFILDTGADGIYLDDAFASRAHVASLSAGGEAGTLYGTLPLGNGRVQSLAIGGNTLSNVIVHTINFSRYDYRGLDAQGLDGLIGYDLFAGALVSVRFSNATMTISDPADADVSMLPGLVLPIDLSDNVPAITTTMNGRYQMTAMLDSGNPGAFFFSPDLIQRYHLLQPMTGCIQMRTLVFGPVTYEAEGACESGFLIGHGMLAGFDLIKHFDITFDYPASVMVMKPLSP